MLEDEFKTEKELAYAVLDRMPDNASFKDITVRFMNVNSANELVIYMAKEGLIPPSEGEKWIMKYINRQ